jgi:hypothetical protein
MSEDVIDVTALGRRIGDLQTDRWIKLMVLAFVGGPLLFLVTIGFGIKGQIERDKSIKLLRQGISCLFADVDDHRHTNQFAHEEMAKKLGVEIIQPDIIPLTREQAAQLKTECEHFVQRTLGVGLNFGDRADPKEKP